MKLIEMSISASCLILLLVLLRTMLLYRVLKRTFVVLWDLALLRLLLPVTLPQIRLSVSAQPIASPVPQIAQTVTEAAQGVTVLLPQTEAARQIPWPAILWAAGAVLCAVLFLAGHWASSRQYRMSLPVEEPLWNAWIQEQQLLRTVRIRQSDQIETPLTYGVLHPVILLPKTLEADRDGLRCILQHELVHIRRFDTLRKWLLAAAVCLHWFNPLVWLLYVLANRDMELACDEAVLRQLGPESRRSYATLLIGLEARRSGLSPLAAGFSRRPMEERITAIMKSKKQTVLSLALAAALVLLAASAFICLEQVKTARKAMADLEKIEQWPEVYAGLSEEEQDAVQAFYGLAEQLYGKDVRAIPVIVVNSTMHSNDWGDIPVLSLRTEVGTCTYDASLLPESGVWLSMFRKDTTPVYDTSTVTRPVPHQIDPASEVYATISALACLDPENAITQVDYLNDGSVSSRGADWYAVTRETGRNLEAIVDHVTGELIGFSLYPEGTDVAEPYYRYYQDG